MKVITPGLTWFLDDENYVMFSSSELPIVPVIELVRWRLSVAYFWLINFSS